MRPAPAIRYDAPKTPSEVERLTARVAELEAENDVMGLRIVEERERSYFNRCHQLEAENAVMRTALGRNRQGYLNILEMRKLSSEQWGSRDGYGGRYGALTREEIEAVIADIEAALSSAPVAAEPKDDPLKRIRTLEANWDTYGAPAINPLSIALAETIRTKVQFVPTSKGGVQAEWHVNGFDIEIEIGPDGSMEAWSSACPEKDGPIRKALALDWLQDQIVDTIYLDDGRIVDVKGGNVLETIEAAAREALKAGVQCDT